MSFGDGTSGYSLIRQTGEPGSNLRHLFYKTSNKTIAPWRLLNTQNVTVGLDLLISLSNLHPQSAANVMSGRSVI